jgi:Fe-S-cluster-containing hydrogenase component 2
MHCVDPVCLIGCPTGAIHRVSHGGTVVINDDTCVGCGTCAGSCPYDNIVMVAIRGGAGEVLRDPADGEPILKATKCDLCSEQPTGPACVQACPHDALQRVDFRDLGALRK